MSTLFGKLTEHGHELKSLEASKIIAKQKERNKDEKKHLLEGLNFQG